MGILVLATSAFVQQQLDALRALAPAERVYTDPATAPAEDVEAILAFKLRAGIAKRFPHLRLIACAGAGADDLLATPDLPDVPIVRPVDPLQAQRIAQYVALMVLRFHRDLPRLEAQHRDGEWQRFAPPDEHALPVAVLGFGASGQAVKRALNALGCDVQAWRRTPGDDGVASGRDALAGVLGRAAVLVCTLPLTRETRGLLDAAALRALPEGAYVVDVSRGGIIDHDALRAAIDRGHVAGAALDVFPEEPLPGDSTLWRHPRILCTPHIAGVPRAHVAVAQFLVNLQRVREGRPVENAVDRTRGY